MRSRGRAHLIGAGPGDPGLLTLRAITTLAQADVIIHDGFLGGEIEKTFPPGIPVIRVSGPPHGHPTAKVASLIARHVRRGRTVVRLYVGDPFLFGSGGEELEALRRRGIRPEVVPGVTSATAAGAEYGIPLTHPQCPDGILILPGRESDVDWAHAARFRGTVLLMMSATHLGENCTRLLAHGMPRRTPAAVVERGTLPGSRVVRGTLGTIAAKARAARVKSPALVFLGEVARLASRPRQRRNIPRGR